MRWIAKNYQVISIWLSLLIVSMGFIIGSDRALMGVGVPLTFFTGALLYLSGSIREWRQNRMPMVLFELLLFLCMLAGMVLSLLRLGGFL